VDGRELMEPRYQLGPGVAVAGTRSGGVLVRLVDRDRVGVTRPRSVAALAMAVHFGEPRTRSSWLERLPADDRDHASREFDAAVDRGLLVAADPPAPEAPMNGTGADGVAQSLIGQLTRLRAQLSTVDPADPPPGDPALVLQLCHHLVQQLTDDIARAQAARARAWARRFTGGVRLHLGCGPHRLPGWVNVDIAAPTADLRVDVRAGLPFDDDSVDAVYIAHLLEHVEYPVEALDVLRECARVLRPGAPVRVAVPDIASFARAYVDGRTDFFTEFERLWERRPADSALASFLHYAGAGEFPWVADRHRFGYDAPTLGALLAAAGFTGARRCAPGDSGIHGGQIDYSWANTATAAGLPFVLIMEAEVAR
jgi:SAM-dependent methyltransferase